MSIEGQTLVALYTALVLQLTVLTGFVLADRYIQRENRRRLLLAVGLLVLLLAGEYAEAVFEERWMLRARTLAAMTCYILRPAVCAVLMQITRKDARPWILVGVNTALYLTAPFSGVVFSINWENHYQRGPLNGACPLVCWILLFWHLLTLFREAKRGRFRELLVPMTVTALLLTSFLLDIAAKDRYRVSFLTVVLVSGTTAYYIWLHLRFAAAHEEALLESQRLKVLMSQIKPHFLSNTLSAIQGLCLVDPERAADLLGKFGIYLRENMEFAEASDLIPFEREIAHTRVYSDIQHQRFPSIRVEYSLEDGDYLLPALTVQPLVENAVRHGVRTRDSGLVTVTAQREGTSHLIVVEDNGAGFDVSALETQGPGHIGLRSVRARLEKQCGGSLRIKSRPGEGTRAEIRVPSGGNTGGNRH